MNLKISLLEEVYFSLLHEEMPDLQKMGIKIFLTIILCPFLYKKRISYHLIFTSLIYFLIYSPEDLLILFSLYFINISYYKKMKESIFKMYFLIFFNICILIIGNYFFKEKGNPSSIGCEVMLLAPKVHFLYQYEKMSLVSVIGYFLYLPMVPAGPAVRITELKRFINFEGRAVIFKSIRSVFFL